MSEAAPSLTPGLEQVANRIARVFRHRRKWARRTAVTCFRVFDHDIADQPLVVEWLDGAVVVWAGERTRNETPEEETAWLAGVEVAIARGLEVAPEAVILKRRRRQRDRHHGQEGRAGAGQYVPLERRGLLRTVTEHGLAFELNLSDYLDTGLFLDHRELRARVRAEAAGKRLLNLFAYTGAFTVHARAGGATGTTTVDLSRTYLAWAERNQALNDQMVGGAHELVRADCLAWLERASAGAWDLVVCDPPTFSASTAMARDFSVQRDHGTLIAACCRLLALGGVLYFSTNARRFRLETNAIPAGRQAEDITAATTPEDFRDRVPRRVWRIG